MPIQLTWQPNSGPATRKNGDRLLTSSDRTDRGLEISGDDPTVVDGVDGRIRLFEVPGTGAGAGPSEVQEERLIATFHGKWHSDPKGPRNTRVTFDIFQGNATFSDPHAQDMQGFDPQCIFGVDALVLTFVNREFVIFLPFHLDSAREGSFLEIVAVAESGVIKSPTELARSSVLSVPIRRKHAVGTTSKAAAYTGDQIGNLVLTPEGYVFAGGVRAPASQPGFIDLLPAFHEVRLPHPVVTFAPYKADTLKILLLSDLLDGLVPRDSFLTGSIKGVTPATVGAVRADALRRFRTLQVTVANLFVDAGFAGAQVLWNDEPAAAAQAQAFTAAFSAQGGSWQLKKSDQPLTTSFWNFFVGSTVDPNLEAGTGERAAGAPVSPPKPHTIDGRELFLHEVFPVGSGDKQLAHPIEIKSVVFMNMLMVSSGTDLTYDTPQEFGAAVDKVAAKLANLVAHEVAHSLGLMHHSKVINKDDYSETLGSPVLSLMSSSVESGGFGIGIKFSAQAKVMWAAAFGVTNTPDDSFLKNRFWTDADVFNPKMTWADRKQQFRKIHGERVLKFPDLGNGQTPPPFAKTAPAAQRGTFVPKP